jgi:hypothetical protein
LRRHAGEERSPVSMLSGDEDLEINALKKRGWSISAIAR